MDFGDKFRLVLASSLREDGYADQGEWSPLDTGLFRRDNQKRRLFRRGVWNVN